MKIMEALAAGSLPVIITEPEEEGLQTIAPEIVVQTGGVGPWLYILIALVIVIALAVVIALSLVMGKKKESQKFKREKKGGRGRDKTPHRSKPKEPSEEHHISQISVPDRNSQVYPEILLVNLDQPDIIYRTYISEHVVIGRREGSDIRITTDTAVSSRHCMISVKGTQFYLEDCNSTNGTRYNDQEVTTQIPILNGGILEIGHTRYRLVIGC